MRLDTKDRIVFSALFAQQDDLINQTLAKDISKKIEITQEEMKKLDLKRVENQGLIWNPEIDISKDVEFSKAEITYLKGRVDILDKQKQITQDVLELCLKIRNENKKEEEGKKNANK